MPDYYLMAAAKTKNPQVVFSCKSMLAVKCSLNHIGHILKASTCKSKLSSTPLNLFRIKNLNLFRIKKIQVYISACFILIRNGNKNCHPIVHAVKVQRKE